MKNRRIIALSRTILISGSAVAFAAAALSSTPLAARAETDDDGRDVSISLGDRNLDVTTTSVLVANSLTASGRHIAPRYMTRSGDVDISLQGGYVNFPKLGGNLLGGQLSLQARLTDDLVLLADAGQQTTLGLRGPIGTWGNARLGWDVHYRSDIYFNTKGLLGLGSPGFGFVPNAPGGVAQGGEVGVNSEYMCGDHYAYLTPQLSIMSNRDAAGAIAGLDLELGRLTLGLGSGAAYNFSNPAAATVKIQPLELRESVGLRFFLTDWAYLQANYHYLLADAYGSPQQTLLVGIGTRVIGNFTKPVVPTPPPPPPEPVVVPTPAPSAAPIPPSLVGRVTDSLGTDGEPGRPVTVALKVRTANGGWKSLPQTVQSDSHGNYVFQTLPPGEYDIVYRSDGSSPRTAGAAASSPVRVKSGATAHADVDIAWDESAIKGTITGNKVSITWPAKPGVDDLVYQVILKYSPDQPFVVGSTPSSATQVDLEVSDEVKSYTLYYTVKYWKKTGTFEGDVPYGQSKYQLLDVAK